MKIKIPEFSLVLLIGPSGAGKSTFGRRFFKPTEVISSDHCRALVSDDENNMDATHDAFEVLRYIAAKRLAAGRLTVIDATNVQPESRKPLVALAREYHCLPVAIVLDVPERVCHDRNRDRPERAFGPHVVANQIQQMRRNLRSLQREGFRHVSILKPEDIESLEIERERLWNNKRDEHGPFDIIGDVHGCFDELCELLTRLGYTVSADGTGVSVQAPPGRRAVFLGDLVDRGPDVVGVLKLVMSMVESGTALCVPGNHEIKLMKKLRGKDVRVSHGLAQSLEQLDREPEAFRRKLADFIDDLVSHYVLDDGRLVVAHAGMKASMQGRGFGMVREFALYGETTGETDEYGLPVRYDWAAEYRGKATVVYGHTPVPDAEWVNNTICIDTGCVFGGKLTALRYPERELVSAQAARVYCEPTKPLLPPSEEPSPSLSTQQALEEVLDLEDVIGRRVVSTGLFRNITIREENATAALEAMSRFATNPKWLIYLPPTMSPSETSAQPGLLEHPAEALAYYRSQGVEKVVCEEKHMGSRAMLVVCRDADTARRRFGITGGESGVVYTRTGRRFFLDAALETAFLDRVTTAVTASGLWDELKTDWICLDAELMPWSVKAQELLRTQYAAVGSSAKAALPEVVSALDSAASRGVDLGGLLDRMKQRREHVEKYVASYQRYCWPVSGLDELRLAPFHLLASEGAVHIDKDHVWHMSTLARLCATDDELLLATPFKVVRLDDSNDVDGVVRWWEELTGGGGEGIVVKPLDFAPRGPKGLVQPAVKCRGPEYLRIIYGPEYTAPQNLDRLRNRAVATKRSLARREFALGIEALQRFVAGQPLRKVHECVFGVLALESEPVDPRL